MNDFDYVIAGAGVAGASVAAELVGHGRVCLLEAEAEPGYHATGRSAAFWSESYGGPLVLPLTSASGPFLKSPPPEFSERSFLHPRGSIHIATAGQAEAVDAMLADFVDSDLLLERWNRERLSRQIPELRDQWVMAVNEPTCDDIDVAGLHAAYLAQARRGGATVMTGSALIKARYRQGGWDVETAKGSLRAGTIIDAAGAWADPVAQCCGIRPLGIEPKRRTMVQVRTDPPSRPELPLIMAIDGSFYAKPEGDGRWWISPHDEIDDIPRDAAPEEIDIAIAADRFEKAFHSRIEHVERSWAGLRSFASDRLPVIGRAPDCADFFWFAGQGGWGIQTAPAAARLAKALLTGDFSDPMLVNLDANRYDPERF